MKALLVRFIFSTLLFSIFFTETTLCSGFPDEAAIRPLPLSRHEYMPHKKTPMANVHTAAKALSELGLDGLDAVAPKVGGYGTVYFGKDAVVKVSHARASMGGSVNESVRLLGLKRLLGPNPVPGVRYAWPGAVFAPKVARGRQLDCLQIFPRLYPVKSMKRVAMDMIINEAPRAQADIFGLGAALGRWQAASLKSYKGKLVTNAHMDLHCNNIFPKGLLSLGQKFEIELIDLGDMRVSSEANAPRIAVDIFYHLLRTWDFADKGSGFKHMSESDRVRRMQAYAMHFFIGLLSEYPPHVRAAIRPSYTSMGAYSEFEADKIFRVNGGVAQKKRRFSYMIQAMAAAFMYHENPSKMANILPFPFLQSFDAALYQELYPDACKDHAAYQMDPNTFAKYHFVTWGFKAGYFFPHNDIKVPAGFNEDDYLDKNPEVKLEAAKFGITGLKAFARIHNSEWGSKPPAQVAFDAEVYIRLNPDLVEAAKSVPNHGRKAWAENHYNQHGRNEQRIFLELPEGFNASTYIDLHPDLKQHTANMQPAERFSFGQTHYMNHGRYEKRVFAALPVGFDALTYIELNPDLKAGTAHLKEEQKFAYGQSHYVCHGVTENRKYQ